METLLTTDTSSILWAAAVFDPVTGSSLATFKSGYGCDRSLCATKERLIIASKDRPILSVWDFRGSRKDGQPQRQTCPGPVSALASSPNHQYVAVGIAEKVHIWQLTDGLLVAVLSAHYQAVTCMGFSDDGSYLVTAGRDSLVLIWDMAQVVGQSSQGSSCSPLHVLSGHTLPVTDLHVGCGGPMAHFITSSLDHSCKVWELCSGHLLCNILFDVPVEAVVADSAESCLFAGCSDGSIHLVSLFPQDGSQERHISKTDDLSSSEFQGHSASVTCLSVSMDGSMLASGSTDKTARIWDVSSAQCLRVIQHKGAVGAIRFILRPPSLPPNQPPPKALAPLPTLQRSFSWAAGAAGDRSPHGGSSVKINRPRLETDGSYEDEVGLPRGLKAGNAKICGPQSQGRGDSEEVTRLRRINAQLYHLYAQSLLKEPETSSSASGVDY